ncbi:MAG: UpxY family transcription antiterminator, partial [Bernardetiaceae bacterium]|nr:UpxY family transcription antiterminator [Bernardetiaceae bacterium]
MTTKNKKWLVIITKPKSEKKVGKRLTEIGIEHLVPLQRQLRQWHDRKKWVYVPLFNSYIFVRIEEKHRNKVFDAAGIWKYLSIGGKIAVLKEQEIERIRRLCSFEGDVEISNTSFEVGEEVEIMAGHFIGFTGTLINVENKDKLK